MAGKSDLKTLFEKACEEAKTLPRRPDDKTLLALYAFYKQVTEGDAAGRRPGFTDPVGRAKFDAWSRLKDISKTDAMRGYIEIVEKLKA